MQEVTGKQESVGMSSQKSVVVVRDWWNWRSLEMFAKELGEDAA
jgi:hypothetical protein